MRILRVHPFLGSEILNSAAGGMGRVSLQLTILLLRQGVEVRLLPLPERILDRYRWDLESGLSVLVEPTMAIPSVRGLVRAFPLAMRLEPRPRNGTEFYLDSMAILALQSALGSFAPHIVHNHVARSAFPRLARALALPQPCVLTHHHGETGEQLDYYARVVFNCRGTRERVARTAGLPAEKTRVVYHPVARPFVDGTVAPAGERDYIAFVGAVRERKGIDVLLEAWSRNARLRRLRVRVFGGGAELPHYAAMAAERCLPFDFAGPLPAAELRSALDRAILVVVPSRLESFSRALSEAVCAGVPIVGWADQIAEMSEVLGIEPGWPFDARAQSADDLVATLLAALRDPLLETRNRRALAAAGRRFFSEDEFAKGYLEIYRELT